MKVEDLVRRAEELITKGEEVIRTQKPGALAGTYVDFGVFRAFRSGSLSFLQQVFGSDHAHYKEFEAVVKTSSLECAEAGVEMLKAVKGEIGGGWMFRVRGVVAGEILGDFIALAKEALSESKEVAAVLACAALEDTLKRIAGHEGLEVEGKDMSAVIGALRSQGILKGAQAPVVSGYVKLRNKAFHAEWDKIEKPEVASAIGFTEQLLVKHFG